MRSSPSTASRSCAGSTPRSELAGARDRARTPAATPAGGRAPERVRHRHPRRPRRGDRRRAVRALRVPHHRGVGARAHRGAAARRRRRDDPPPRTRRAGCSRTTASASCTRTPGPAISRGTRASAGTPTTSRGRTSTVWPSVAFTIHVDATSPQNGFLRVLPGSHLGGTDDMPLGFEKVPGEMAVYCERGDVLLHHSDLWHSAARATDDGEGAIRRHVRGGWYGGDAARRRTTASTTSSRTPAARHSPRSGDPAARSAPGGRCTSPA